jgi:AraC-like DNA-binding protein
LLGRIAPQQPFGRCDSRRLVGRFAPAGLGGCLVTADNPGMAASVRSPLSRYPVIDTRNLAAARDATSRFWPKHTSEVLGPDDYALEMHRVLLGDVALTYVACTSRLRVVSVAPATEYALYMPLEGEISVVADGADMTASAERPLVRGPARTFVFEPSPIRCFVVDVPAEALAAAAGADVPLARHASLSAPTATALARLVMQLAKAANRSRSLVALQGFSRRDRLARLPDAVASLERRIVELVAHGATFQPSVGGACDVESLKRWLAGQAHRRVRVAELASAAGVSQRTVERAFLRSGCTPLDYLRRVRLTRARTMLAGPLSDLAIADVAAAVGYAHLGRFSDDYRRHFGELPSQAAARLRGRRV